MKQETKIRLHFKTEYDSSPVPVDNKEIAVIINNDCECCNCGKSIFELDDHPSIIEDEVWCEQCDRDEHYSYCPICEDSYENPTLEGGHYLVISKEAIEEYGMGIKPGFYQVKEYPFFFGDIVCGFNGLLDDTIELIRECDINSMIHKLYPHAGEEKISADSCCENCMKKYTGQTVIKNNYCDKKYGKKRVILEKEVIAAGC